MAVILLLCPSSYKTSNHGISSTDRIDKCAFRSRLHIDFLILCHQDSYRLGMGSDHGDVLHWFPKFGKDMAAVRRDVAALLKNTLQEDEDEMTIEQVKKIVKEENDKVNPTYNTIDDVPDYWREDIRWLMARGIIKGNANGKLGLTRGEAKAAVMVKRGMVKAGVV